MADKTNKEKTDAARTDAFNKRIELGKALAKKGGR